VIQWKLEMQARTRVVLVLALWCGWMLPAAAAGYQVELIVFAYPQPNTDGEQFANDEGLPTAQGLAQLGGGDQGVGPVMTPLPVSSYRLNGVLSALRRGGKYRPLLHTSWIQPEGGRIRGVFVSTSAPPVTSDPPAAGEERVMGGVRLRVTRFLHVDVDLAYFPGAATPILSGDGGSVRLDHVRLTESRKIKFNEVHYFDHPLFGALLQVSRAGGGAIGDTDAAAPQE
jgi:hypothetical protein